MQHQALKYSPSLLNDGQFTQGLSHWFGSYVAHVKDEEHNLYAAKCAANLAGAYQVGMPYGISQYIDSPEMHSYPASRTANLVRLIPLSSQLAMLVTTSDTLLEGAPLVPGIEGESSPTDQFQHPFRWQDRDGAVAIEPTSRMSVRGREGYAGEYTAGSLLVAPSPDTRAVAHHRLYVSPTTPLPAEASNATYGSTRVECLPNADLENGFLVLRGPDEDQLNRIRATISQIGASRLVVTLDTDRQVQVVGLMGDVVAGTPNEYKLELYYSAIHPGGLAPDQAGSFTEWSLFRITDVECKYTMPLYGYRYTLAYSYRDRRPRRAELTFRQAEEGPDGYTLDGFGTVRFRVTSDATARTQFGARNNYLRNIEVLRAESRNKVVGRPMLSIPVLDVTEPLPRSRTVTRVRKVSTGGVTVVDADNTVVDTQARPVLGFSWEEGITNSAPGKLWLPGIVNPELLDDEVEVGDFLGLVVFTGHLTAQNLSTDGASAYVEDVANLLSRILYSSNDEITASLFFGQAPGSPGDLYVTFVKGTETIYTSSDLDVAVPDPIDNSTYYVDTSYGDTLGIRGEHFGTDLTLEIPRITVGTDVVFADAEEPLLFLNSNTYEVSSIRVNPLVGGVPVISYELIGVSDDDLAPTTSVLVSPLVGTQIGITESGVSEAEISYITDVSMWLGDRTSELPTSSQVARDLLERHTDPLDSLFPKGTVMLYAGGGTCPAGFKPVQATAESAQPGVPDSSLVSPENTIYDAVTNTTKIKFPLGSLPPLLDPTGGVISLTSPATVPVPALSLEFEGSQRLPAISPLGDAIQLATVVQTFRNAVEVGMTLRVQESTDPDGAPLVAEDRGFMIVNDQAADLPPVYQAASARRSKRPPNGGSGYRTGDNDDDVSITQNPLSSRYDPADPAYHWGTGYGTVTYPSADQGRMAAYSASSSGYNRLEDQGLRTNNNVSAAFQAAMGGTNFASYALVPEHPERFTQTPQFAPVAPGIWGQRERFFFDTPESETPRTDFTRSPSISNKRSPAILMLCQGFDGEVQIDMGISGGQSRIGMPKGGNYGYLPNPAWDLLNLNQMTADDFEKFPAQPIQTSTDLLAGGSFSASQGRIPIYEGMVFFCRIYGKCQSIDENGNPQGITGWFDTVEGGEGQEADGIGCLVGTLPLMTFEVESAPGLDYEENVNMRPYDFPLSGSNNARGNSPHPTRGGATWPADLNREGFFILQLTPLTLYGTPNQPQDFGEVEYLDWSTGETRTGLGRSAGPLAPQTEFTYRRQLEEVEEDVIAWSTVGSGVDTSTLTVLGNATGLETGNRPIFVEPSGYLKYGSVGARMDYGPGRHTHDLERNPNLLGPGRLAQPDDTSGRYLSALPSVHGHENAADSRSPLPVANLFTSCIKL
jgi:hypothetical protein